MPNPDQPTKLDPFEVARKLSIDIAERNNWTDPEDFEQAEQQAGQIVAFLCSSYPDHFIP